MYWIGYGTGQIIPKTDLAKKMLGSVRNCIAYRTITLLKKVEWCHTIVIMGENSQCVEMPDLSWSYNIVRNYYI